MRFWTSFQGPLFQAALIENGKVVRTIPDHPPKTPVNFIHIVGEYKDKLVITRRSDHQIWSLDGKTHELQLYTPYVYAPHWVGEWNGFVLAGSGGLDVVYLLDLEGKISWAWWLCDHSKRPKDFRALMQKTDWLDYQVSRRLPEERMCGLNSIHKQSDGSVVVTMMKMNAGIRLQPTPYVQPALLRPAVNWLSALLTRHDCPHDVQLDPRNGRLVYGAKDGFVIDEEVVLSYEFVKRVRPIEGGYLITHERGVVVTDMDGKEKKSIPLPRPFGVFHLEM
jgi:hypothetical protein